MIVQLCIAAIDRCVYAVYVCTLCTVCAGSVWVTAGCSQTAPVLARLAFQTAGKSLRLHRATREQQTLHSATTWKSAHNNALGNKCSAEKFHYDFSVALRTLDQDFLHYFNQIEKRLQKCFSFYFIMTRTCKNNFHILFIKRFHLRTKLLYVTPKW